MQDIVYVIAKLQARAGQEETLRKLIAESIALTLKEKGCRSFLLLQDRQSAAVFTLLEEWDTQGDLDTHLALPRMQKLFAVLPELLSAPPEIVRYRQLL
jgi:quinol monooxygenase YgiN